MDEAPDRPDGPTREVHGALGAVARVARALVGASRFDDLADHALAEMRAALGLEVVALYLPVTGAPGLRRHEALWYSRFAVGPDTDEYRTILRYERAWDDAFRERPVVTLCPYVVGGLDGGAAAERIAGVATVHDGVLAPGADDGWTLLRRG